MPIRFLFGILSSDILCSSVSEGILQCSRREGNWRDQMELSRCRK